MPNKPHFKRYWTEQRQEAGDDVCMNCGDRIDFENEAGVVGVRVDIGVEATDEQKAALVKHIFCSECGTDVDVLKALGIKRLIGFLNGPSGSIDRLLEYVSEDEPIN